MQQVSNLYRIPGTKFFFIMLVSLLGAQSCGLSSSGCVSAGYVAGTCSCRRIIFYDNCMQNDQNIMLIVLYNRFVQSVL